MNNDIFNKLFEFLLSVAGDASPKWYGFYLRWLLLILLISAGCIFARARANHSKIITGLICLCSILVTIGFPFQGYRAGPLESLVVISLSLFAMITCPRAVSCLIVNERWMVWTVTGIWYFAILITFIANSYA